METQTEQKFTSDWFSKNIPVWEKTLADFKGKKNLNALEIGSWEGRSASWLLENILTDDTSRLVCVDNFTGNPEVAESEQKNADLAKVKDTLIANLAGFGWGKKCFLAEIDSHEFLKACDEQFDIIYVDGSHFQKDVLIDLVLAWQLLKKGGVIILDDYLYHMPGGATPRIAIDAFYYVMKDEIEKIHCAYQMTWRKK